MSVGAHPNDDCQETEIPFQVRENPRRSLTRSVFSHHVTRGRLSLRVAEPFSDDSTPSPYCQVETAFTKSGERSPHPGFETAHYGLNLARMKLLVLDVVVSPWVPCEPGALERCLNVSATCVLGTLPLPKKSNEMKIKKPPRRLGGSDAWRSLVIQTSGLLTKRKSASTCLV